MGVRYWLALGIFLAAIGVAILLRPGRSGGEAPGVPDAAVDAMRQGRYLLATQLMRRRLHGTQDTSAETIVLLARAEAGWGDWAQVEKLLAGRAWLDRVEGGAGRELLGRARLAGGDWSGGAADLARYLDVAEGIDDRARGIAQVRRGQALQRAGQEAAALAAFDAGARELPPVRDWIGWLAAGAAADAGDTAQVRLRLAALPPAFGRERGWRLSVRAAARACDSASALSAALAAAASLPTADARAAAWETAGELRRALGDDAGARDAFLSVLAVGEGTSSAAPAARALLKLGALTPEQRLTAGLALLAARDAAGAAPAMRAYLAVGGVPAVRRAQLLYQLGGGLFDGGRYGDAIATLQEAIPGLDAQSAARATYTVARAQLRLDRVADARATLLRVAQLYANQPSAADALFLLGDLEQDAGNAARAAAWFQRVAALPSPPAATGTVGDAYMRLGAMAYEAGQYGAAAQTYEAYRRRFPGGEDIEQATYWSARAYARLGQDALARARLQELARSPSLSYYVVLAAARLGTPLLDAAGGSAPGGSGEHHDLLTAGIERVDLLHELGLDVAAAEEATALRWRLGNDDSALYDLAEALNARGLTSQGISIGRELRRRAGAWNTRLLRIVYPFPYREAVVAEAAAHGLDPYLVAGLIHQESNFTPDARSRVGAVGLMQVMPGTGRVLGRSSGIGRVDAAQLEDPDLNMRLGTQFVAELLRRTDGNVPEMLAAYNAGPARLDRWQDFPEARDPELFAERIPYDETRSYVKIVQANARIYAALYPDLDRGETASGR